VRRVHWKDSGGLLFFAQPSSREEVHRRYRQEVDSRRRQSNDSSYPPDPGSINVFLWPARSPATQTRQAPVPTPFPAARATTPTSTGVESVCCTGNAVRNPRGSRDTQRGAPLLPWSCEKEADPVGPDLLGVLRPESAGGEFCSPEACRARALGVRDGNRGLPHLDRRRARNLVLRGALTPGWSHLDHNRAAKGQYLAVQGFGAFPINDLSLHRGRHARLEAGELQCRSGNHGRHPQPPA
jgi:hypothetical protein